MLFDTHAHVNFQGFKEDANDVIQRSLDAGVWINNVGTQKDTSKAAVVMAEQYLEGVFATVGLHPIHTYSQHVDEEESKFQTREETFDYEYYKNLAGSPKVIGIGEAGLDYFRMPEGYSIEDLKKLQIPAFEAQLKLANELDKALVIHCRPSVNTQDAYEDLITILKATPAKRFEIHSFTSNWEICEKFLELGAFIGMNGIVSFDKTGVLKEVVEKCPLDKIVLETDAPYLAPSPYRGKRNEPLYVQYVAEFIAKIKGISLEEVSTQTTKNAKDLFRV
jgi:TatD DNase family protein